MHIGASALHLSIAYNNNDLIQDLVDAGANICQRAIGIIVNFIAICTNNSDLNIAIYWNTY